MIAKNAAPKHVEEVKAFVKSITEVGKNGADMSKGLALQGPAFPVAGKSGTVSSDTIQHWP